MAELFFEDETIGTQDPSLPSNLTQDLGASTYRAPNFTQQNLGTRAFPHDPSVFDQWGNRAMEEEKGNYHEPPRGLSTLKNWASNKLGTGVNWASDKLGTGVNWGKMAVSGIGNAIMPGLGFVLGAMNPEKMRGYNYDEGRFNTQEEYEAARTARQHQTRVGNLISRMQSGKNYSQKNLNEITMGSRPGYYGNRSTVSNINRAKHNIGMPENLGDRGNISVSRSTNTKSPGHPSNANPGSGGGIGSAAAGRGPAGGSIGASRSRAQGGRIGYNRGRVVNPGGYAGDDEGGILEWIKSKMGSESETNPTVFGTQNSLLNQGSIGQLENAIKSYEALMHMGDLDEEQQADYELKLNQLSALTEGATQKAHGGIVGLAQGGRIGYRNGEFVDEDINVEGPNFDVNENIEMAETSPFEIRIEELMDEGMSWQEAYQIASEEFGQIVEGESDQGIASIV